MENMARNSFSKGLLKCSLLRKVLVVSCLFFHQLSTGQGLGKDVFISIEAQRSTLYSILNQVSEQSGYFFVYDTQIIDNRRVVNVAKTNSELFSFLRSLLPGKEIGFRVLGRHILIFETQTEKTPASLTPVNVSLADTTFTTISGVVFDQNSGERLPFASVGIASAGLGVSTNLDGYFRLRVPHALFNETITIQHLGYQSKQFPVELLRDNTLEVFLSPSIIDLPEVVIRNYNPLKVLDNVLDLREKNFPDKPVYHYNFYREGVSRNKKLINYSEGIFKIFKDIPFQESRDQVKVLRGRNTTNIDNTDTLVLKLKAGVQSTLELDIMKVLPDFLHRDFMVDFDFANGGFSTRGGRSAYAIQFEQKKEIKNPLYKGVIYVDMEDYAIIEAEFEINPKFIANAGSMFFIGWKKEFAPTMQKAKYHVRYQKYNGFYHIHHIRGDLELSVKPSGSTATTDYSAFFETVVVKIAENDVKRFPGREAIKPNAIFLDLGFETDELFWGEYNVITPETGVIEAFNGIKARIESFLEE